MKKLISIFMCSILILACSKEDHSKPAEEAKEGSKGTISMTDKDLPKPSSEVLKGFVKPEDLAIVLPESFNSFEKFPPATGASYEDKDSWTTASADYRYTRRSQVNIAIFDYKTIKNIPNPEYFEKAPKEEGFETNVYELPNGKAYSLWNSKSRTGALKALINNRFIIDISAKTLPPKIDNIKFIFDIIDLTKLNELENKAKNQ